MEVSETYPGVPSEVLKRCYGKQAPITPHSQRLLVAATKEAKAEAKGHGKGNGKGKGKGKGSKPKIPPKRSLKEKKQQTRKRSRRNLLESRSQRHRMPKRKQSSLKRSVSISDPHFKSFKHGRWFSILLLARGSLWFCFGALEAKILLKYIPLLPIQGWHVKGFPRRRRNSGRNLNLSMLSWGKI